MKGTSKVTNPEIGKKLKALRMLIREGRQEVVRKDKWSIVEPFFGSFCREKELKSLKEYRNASNLENNAMKNNYENLYKEIGGTTMSKCLSKEKYAFIITCLHNYLTDDNNQDIQWNTEESRFTSKHEKSKGAGWTQEGLDFYMSKLKEESKYRKLIDQKHQDERDRPDFFKNINEDNDDIVYFNNSEEEVQNGNNVNQEDYEIPSDSEDELEDNGCARSTLEIYREEDHTKENEQDEYEGSSDDETRLNTEHGPEQYTDSLDDRLTQGLSQTTQSIGY